MEIVSKVTVSVNPAGGVLPVKQVPAIVMSVTVTAGAVVGQACVTVVPDSKGFTVKSLTASLLTAPVMGPVMRGSASVNPDGWVRIVHQLISDSGSIYQIAPAKECLTLRRTNVPAFLVSLVITVRWTSAAWTVDHMDPVRSQHVSVRRDGSVIDVNPNPVMSDASLMDDVTMEPVPVIRDFTANTAP
jgi:hypothetical protein